MAELTEEQQERIEELYNSYTRRIESHRELRRKGNVPDEKLSTFYTGLAERYRKLGIFSVHRNEIPEARTNFRRAAENYRNAAGENRFTNDQSLNLARAVYAAALAGDVEDCHDLAGEIEAVQQDYDGGPDDPHADRIYFTRCLAGAILGRVGDGDLDHLEHVNDGKPDVDALYGRAVIDFAGGVDEKDRQRVEGSIHAMVEHHERKLDRENVIDLIMAPQATALLVLARQKGYVVDVDSEFVPDALVDELT